MFSAGSITQESERQTLSLLLTTCCGLARSCSPSSWRPCIIHGTDVLTHGAAPTRIYLASRASSALLDPTRILAHHRHNMHGDVDDRSDVLVVARRTGTAMVMTYLTLLTLFVLPLGVRSYLQTIASEVEDNGNADCNESVLGGPRRADAQHTHRSLDQPASGCRRSVLIPIVLVQTARLGNLPLSLSAPGTCLLLDNLPGVSMAVVACRRARIGDSGDTGDLDASRSLLNVRPRDTTYYLARERGPATWERMDSPIPRGLAPTLSRQTGRRCGPYPRFFRP